MKKTNKQRLAVNLPVWLTKEELEHFYKYNFSEFPKLDGVRDIFCFSSLTGLCFSDLAQLSGNHLISQKRKNETYWCISLTTAKTGKRIQIPLLNKNALAIIDKYKGKLKEDKCLPVISNQDFNHYLKEAAEKAGINQPVSITRFIGQERVDEIFPKYKKLTSLSGRHTFCIISAESGMNPFVLQEILGYAKTEQIKAYFDLTTHFVFVEMEKAFGFESASPIIENVGAFRG